MIFYTKNATITNVTIAQLEEHNLNKTALKSSFNSYCIAK